MKTFFVLLTVLLISTVPESTAQLQSQSAEPYGEHTFRHLASVQLERSLDSPLAMVRAQTLKNALVFSTLYRDQVDLTDAVPKIAEIAEHDDTMQNRRLALAALRAIGSSTANRYLSRLGEMDEKEYRTLVAGVISEYYELHNLGAF